MRRWLVFLWMLCLPLWGGTASADDDVVAVPPLVSRVTDLTGTLDVGQKTQLESALRQIETAKGAQVAILLLPSVKPEAIEQYGIRVAEAWKLGRKGVDDGLIIIVAKADRRMRIEVGYGLEGNIPDAVAKRIISEEMAPRFKQGDYFGGLQAAVQTLAARIGDSEGTPPTEADQAEQDDGMSWFSDHATLLFFFIFGAGVLHALLGFMGYVVVAGIAGVVAFLATASWLIALGAGLAVFLLSLLGLGRMGGGFPSGGGWGSSSGGGFSGGGGGFGGGGASGDW